jgi:hypothetical protein
MTVLLVACRIHSSFGQLGQSARFSLRLCSVFRRDANPFRFALRLVLYGAMILRRAISPYPAKSIADLKLEDKVYKPDFEISNRFQALSKELVRISFLGIGVYGFLLKVATDATSGNAYLQELRHHNYLAGGAIVAFAICATGALLHGFFSNQCLGHQLVISRYFGRLEGDRWDERSKEQFREEIRHQQRDQRRILIFGNRCLLLATVALICGAVLIAACSSFVFFHTPTH